MIIFYHLRWRWLCWIGLHEYMAPYESQVFTCDMCGKTVGKPYKRFWKWIW